nr:hypothetical protein [Sicyoidochytrium minutum DNA virus]
MDRVGKVYFGRVVLIEHDYGGDNRYSTTNSQAFTDVNLLVRDIVQGGHLSKLLGRKAYFHRDAKDEMGKYNNDLERVEKMEDTSGLPKHKLDLLYGRMPRPDDYFSWKGYIEKYTLFPVQNKEDFTRLLLQAESGRFYMSLKFDLQECDLGDETTIGKKTESIQEKDE